MTDAEKGRRSGRTTQQMQSAASGAVFVWCNSRLQYPEALARHLGRDDLVIVRPSWLEENRWRGQRLSGFVVDHAAQLSVSQGAAAAEILVRAT